MTKFNALVVSVLLVCALLLVTSQHRARKAFIDLGRAQSQARKLEVEWNQLQLEQTQLAKHSLIDAVARRDLQMQPVAPGRTLYQGLPSDIAPTAQIEIDSVPEMANAPPLAVAQLEQVGRVGGVR